MVTVYTVRALGVTFKDGRSSTPASTTSPAVPVIFKSRVLQWMSQAPMIL